MKTVLQKDQPKKNDFDKKEYKKKTSVTDIYPTSLGGLLSL